MKALIKVLLVLWEAIGEWEVDQPDREVLFGGGLDVDATNCF